MQVGNKEIAIAGRLLKIARIREEWQEDLEDPESLIRELKKIRINADIFTFWQRPPEHIPKYKYYMELEPIAVLHIKSFDNWFKAQIDANARRAIRKADKKGVVVKRSDFNDEFVTGITSIYNETPIRQGKPFWHYGKGFDDVKRENSTYLDRCDFIGAYYNSELIGFIKLVYEKKFAHPMQILSKMRHNDKAPTYALLAKAVESCEVRGVPYLVYYSWSKGGLGEFKRRNGFVKVGFPRYYVPLNMKGAIALKMRLHRDISGILPERVISLLIELRKKWYTRKYRNVNKI